MLPKSGATPVGSLPLNGKTAPDKGPTLKKPPLAITSPPDRDWETLLAAVLTMY